MSRSQLAQIEKDLRCAVREQRYPDAERLTVCYCATAEEELQEFPSGDPRIERTARQAVELLDWARTMMCVARALTKAELLRLPFLNKYVHLPGRAQETLMLDA